MMCPMLLDWGHPSSSFSSCCLLRVYFTISCLIQTLSIDVSGNGTVRVRVRVGCPLVEINKRLGKSVILWKWSESFR